MVVAFDEGHFNVHSLQTPYKALGEVASELGFVPRPHTGQFSAASLEGVRILVACCARATATGPLADQGRPAHRDEELDALEQWVKEGGSLLLREGEAQRALVAAERERDDPEREPIPDHVLLGAR